MTLSSATPVERLSRLLLDIADAGHDADVATFVCAVMETLRQAIGFHFGWCGVVADRAAGWPRLHCMGGARLPATFIPELQVVAPLDDWGRGVVANAAIVHRWSGFVETDERLDEFVRRHDMFHGMAQSVGGGFGGRSFVVAVYRERGTAGFSDGEAELFRLTCHHIRALWWHRIEDALALGGAVDPARAALVSNDGALLYAGRVVCDAIDESIAQWDGTQLPGELLAAIGTRPAATLRIGRLPVAVTRATRTAGHFHLSLAEAPGASPLSPREWRAARLYAAGASYKQVAQRLALSPATVRTYLQGAYAKLSVANKVQLGAALERLGPPTPWQ
ncbi:MAG: LuxR C-terminal-related transcriptional regulator [Betaproteobacteria bacterium]